LLLVTREWRRLAGYRVFWTPGPDVNCRVTEEEETVGSEMGTGFQIHGQVKELYELLFTKCEGKT
jgi:hypothetical protein